MLLIVSLVYLVKKGKRQLRQARRERAEKLKQEIIEETEKLEKEAWLRKARGEDSEDIVKKRLADLNIDPSTKNLDTFENQAKVGLEIKLTDLKAELSGFEKYSSPRSLELFSKLPYAAQDGLLAEVKSQRNLFEKHQRELEERLYEVKDRLPEIDAQFSLVVEAFQKIYKELDRAAAEFSRRMKDKSDKRGSPTAEADVGDAEFLKDDLPTLERKYSTLKNAPPVWKDTVAKLRLDEFRRSISTLNEQGEYYVRTLAAAPLARQQEYLDMLRQVKPVSSNYCTIFQKYLGDYPELLKAAQEFDEAIANAIDEVQQIISHPESVDDGSKEVTEFIGRSLPRKRVMTVNDIVVAYEHRYDSIQNLIRGVRSPSEIQKKITEVLTANPDADLVPLEGALGIKVISVQRKGRDRNTPSAGGIYVGSDE